MGYTYDRRASDEEWVERQGNVDDAKSTADEVLEGVRKDPDGELQAVIEKAKELVDALDAAAICEKQHDFDASVKEASKAVKDLKELLRAALTHAKREGLDETIEVVEDALGEMRDLTSDVKDLLPDE